jgi:hypothetical protein
MKLGCTGFTAYRRVSERKCASHRTDQSGGCLLNKCRDTVHALLRRRSAASYIQSCRRNSAGDFDAYTYLGFAGDVPVAGDWNGDGIDNAGVYTPSGTYGGLWTLVNQNIPSPAYTYVWYGIPPGTRPVVGDWNGSGDTTVGLQQPNPTTGVSAFLLKNQNESGPAPTTDPAFFYGIPTDQPLAGNWVASCSPAVVSGASVVSSELCFVQPNPTPTFIPTPNYGTCQVQTQKPTGNEETGLKMRESPTIYSPLLTTIPWNTSLTVQYRLNVGTRIWYQVTFQGTTGWIAAFLGQAFVNNTACSVPEPYPSNWPDQAVIDQADFVGGQPCTQQRIDDVLRQEPTELLLARVAYAEAAIYNPSIPGAAFTGGIVFEDGLFIAWIIRLNALMGTPNYGALGRSGQSVTPTELILQPSSSFQPINDLRSQLMSLACNPASISSSDVRNVRRMVYPENSTSENGVELYQLWRLYQIIVINKIITSSWTLFPFSQPNLRGFDQFKGRRTDEICPQGGNGLSRPGSGFTWAANQPYPPKPVYEYIHPIRGTQQLRKTCYQDVYHLDDLLWTALNQNTPDLAQLLLDYSSNIFPQTYAAVFLWDPSTCGIYPLAQLTGLNGSPWPTGIKPATCP